MKKSKFLRAVAAVTVSAVSAAACLSTAGCAHKHSWGAYTPAGDSGHYRVCTECEEPEAISSHNYDAGYKCNDCGYQHTHKYSDGWTTTEGSDTHWHASTCGHDVTSGETGHVTDAVTGNCVCGYHEHKFSTTLSKDYETHWYGTTCGHDVKSEEHGHNYVNHVCENCGQQETALAKYEFNPAVIGTTSKLGSAWTDGTWTVSSGTEIRGRNIASVTDVTTNQVVATPGTDGEGAVTHSVKMGDDKSTLTLKASSAGTLVIWVSNGSTGKETGAIKINGTSYTYGGSGGWQITYNVPAAGTYTIARNGSVNGTSDIYYASFTARLPVTAVESIEVVNAGTTDYYVGQEFSSEGLAINAVYETTGVKAPVTGFSVDSSAFNKDIAGEYTINVSYTSAVDGNKKVETSYKVKVYSYESLALTDRYTAKDGTNTAGNSVYATHVLKTFYLLGDELDTDGLVVTLTGKSGSANKNFVLSKNDYTVSGYNKDTAGKQTITVTAGTLTKTFDVYVADFAASSFDSGTVAIKVDKSYGESDLGVLDNGAYKFDSITHALEFLDSLQAAGKLPAKSTINLAAGKYEEKLEITIPNLTIIGAGADTTTIEYDELWGVKDATGFVQTTDSTATLNVRDTADGFIIKGVTISNYYNASDKYPAGADGRALAMLVQADKVIVQDCALLGWQDTVELFTGRQYFINTLITGTTDFIFGTNNTTYFYKCEIRTVENKTTKGGGYITAMKGQNKGSSDKVTYGVIFDDCDFTAESAVPNQTAAIGRTWGADAAVMIMNSRLGSHITKTEGSRYVSMNNNSPAKAQFLEYNNTGAGAVTASASNKYWTVPSATDAAKYNNLALIFSKTANTNLNSYYANKGDWNVTVTVTVHYGESGTATVDVRYGTKLTNKILAASVSVPTGKYIEGIYADDSKTPLDLNAGVSENTDVYVEFADLENVDVNIATLLAGGNIKYTPNGGAETPINAVVGTGTAYNAGKIELGDGVSATFDDNCVKVNNVKPNATSSAWALNWSGVDGGAAQYDTYITLGGPSTSARYLAVDVQAGCKIKVYCAATGSGRTATISTAAGTPAANATANGSTILGAVTATGDGVGFVLEATVSSAGTYYINCSNAISFFRVVVEY